MLVVMNVIEQRYRAVMEVIDDGATIKDVAARYGVSRRTLHRWLVRYANEGMGALADQSTKPDRCSHQMSPEIEARIIEMRTSHPGWGPRTIRTKLIKEFVDVPSRSAIYRALIRHNKIDPKARRKRREDYVRWERKFSMELWQMDVVGRIFLADGTHLYAITGIDDHSRFCVSAKLVKRATARPVCDALLDALHTWGMPQEILTDNGKVFTGKRAMKPSMVLFDRICHNNGIKHILTAPFSPTTTGKVERLHRTMRKEFFDLHTFDTLEQAQVALDSWVSEYNNEREHQSLGDKPPIRRFELVQNRETEVVNSDAIVAPNKKFILRKVDGYGRISILKNKYHIGKYLAYQQVRVEPTGGLLNVFHNNALVATHAKKHLVDDDDKMMGAPKATRPAKPTIGEEVFRLVDRSGSVSFAGTAYRVSNKHKGALAGVRLVKDTVQITIDGMLIRTHKARHDTTKEFGAMAQPQGHRRKAAS